MVLLFKHMVIPKIVELEKQIIQFLQVNSFIFIDFYLPRDPRTHVQAWSAVTQTSDKTVRGFLFSAHASSMLFSQTLFLSIHQLFLISELQSEYITKWI